MRVWALVPCCWVFAGALITYPPYTTHNVTFVDTDPVPFQVNLTGTVEDANPQAQDPRVAVYHVRFARSPTDFTGKFIANITVPTHGSSSSNETRALAFSYRGTSMPEAPFDQIEPSYIVVFSVGETGLMNPTPFATPWKTATQWFDLAFPTSTPLQMLPCLTWVCLQTFTFQDHNPLMSQFTGNLTLFLDASKLGTSFVKYFEIFTDPGVVEVCSSGCSLASFSSAVVTPLVASNSLSTQLLLSNLTLVNNTIYVCGSNYDGRGPLVKLMLTDLVPSVQFAENLDGALTRYYVTKYTPEKLAMFDLFAFNQTTGLYFNHHDTIRIAVAISNPNSLLQVGLTWLVNGEVATGGDFPGLSSATTDLGPLVLDNLEHNNLTIGLTVTAVSGPGATLPQVTAPIHGRDVKLFVSASAQDPSAGIPSALLFMDTNFEEDVVGGNLIIEESQNPLYPRYANSIAATNDTLWDTRQFDYYVVYLTSDAQCGSSDDVLAGYLKFNASAAYGTPQVMTIESKPYRSNLGVVVVETKTRGLATRSSNCTVIPIVDISYYTAPPAPVNASFVDIDGRESLFRGIVQFTKNPALNYSTVEQFEIYQASGKEISAIVGSPIATVRNIVGVTNISVWLGNLDALPFLANQTDPEISISLFSNTTQLPWLLVISRTFDNGLGTIVSVTAASVLMVDRRDDYWLVNELVENSGMRNSSLYYPFVEQRDGQDGQLTLGWVAVKLDGEYRVFEWDGDESYEWMLSQSSKFYITVQLGDSGSTLCSVPSSSTWPADAPVDNTIRNKNTTTSGFLRSADFDDLVGCGFSSDPSDPLVLVGTMSLYLFTHADRTDSTGTTVPAWYPQIRIVATLRIQFDDQTHAIALVSIDNIDVLDGVEDTVVSTSEVLFYTEGFAVVDTTPSFTAETTTMYVEHRLTTNAEVFYMTLERAWFAASAELGSLEASLADIQPDSTAFVNQDSVPVKGRYRFITVTPVVLNCLPCYLHVESRLSIRAKQNDEQTTKFSSSSSVTTIEPLQPRESAAMHTAQHSALIAMAVMGIVSRAF